VGINDDIAFQLTQEIGPRFAYDTYARFLMSYGIIVMGEDPARYQSVICDCVDQSLWPSSTMASMASRGVLMVGDLLHIVDEFKKIHKVDFDHFVA
jgi:hypothetical protein